jgi:hypothetical protein
VLGDVVQLVPQSEPAFEGFPRVTDNLHFGSRPASVLLNFNGGQMNDGTQILDVINVFALAKVGEVITADSFAHGVSAANNPYSNPAAGLDFYLAGMVDTGIFLDPGEPSVIAGPGSTTTPEGMPHDVRFGWAHIVFNQAGTATVLSSAIAYGEGGIVVGSLQAVPEPGSAALALIGLVAVGLSRRKAC